MLRDRDWEWEWGWDWNWDLRVGDTNTSNTMKKETLGKEKEEERLIVIQSIFFSLKHRKLEETWNIKILK